MNETRTLREIKLREIKAYSTYQKISQAQWRALVNMGEAEINNAQRVANGGRASQITGNGRNRTTAAMVKLGVLIATPRENATYGAMHNLAVSQLGWDVLAEYASLFRPADAGRLTLEEALNEAHYNLRQGSFPGCLSLEDALEEAARMGGWNFTGLRGYRPEDMGTEADPAARPGARVRIRRDAKTQYAGRTGTVSPSNRGIVNNPGHPNHGLPYVTVDMDATKKAPYCSPTRQFLSDLELESASSPAQVSRPSERITLRSTVHGSFQVSAESLDRLMDRYLPASPAQLRKLIAERTDNDYSDLATITECLMVLGELDGLATN